MDNKELKEMRKERYKNDGKRFMKILLFPLIAIAFFGFMVALWALGGDLDNLFFVLVLIFLVPFVAIPVTCFQVAKRVFRNKEKRFWLSMITPLMITLPFLILLGGEAESYIYAAVIFVWCELWSFLGAVRYKKKEKEI